MTGQSFSNWWRKAADQGWETIHLPAWCSEAMLFRELPTAEYEVAITMPTSKWDIHDIRARIAQMMDKQHESEVFLFSVIYFKAEPDEQFGLIVTEAWGMYGLTSYPDKILYRLL